MFKKMPENTLKTTLLSLNNIILINNDGLRREMIKYCKNQTIFLCCLPVYYNLYILLAYQFIAIFYNFM